MRIAKLIILSFIILSCKYTALDIPLPNEGNKMVVFGVLTANTPIEIKIKPTHPPIGEIKLNEIENAHMLLFENNVLVSELNYAENGIYTSSFKPQVGLHYHLEVSCEGYETLISEAVVIPDMPEISEIDFTERIVSTMNDGVPAQKLKLIISDKLETVDFYSFSSYFSNENEQIYLPEFSINDLAPDESPCYAAYFQQNIYNDYCQKNSKLEIERGYELETGYFESNAPVTATFIIRKLTKSYYDFAVSQYPYVDLESAFITPGKTVSNIKGGYGMIAGASEIKVKLNL